jgi:hypothetical protein
MTREQIHAIEKELMSAAREPDLYTRLERVDKWMKKHICEFGVSSCVDMMTLSRATIESLAHLKRDQYKQIAHEMMNASVGVSDTYSFKEDLMKSDLRVFVLVEDVETISGVKRTR